MSINYVSFFFILLLSVGCLNKNDAKKTVASSPLSEARQQRLDSLDIFLSQKSNEDILPGFAVSIFSKDSVYFSKGYGFANMEKGLRYNPQTTQMIASVSKTLISVALMKAVEEGKLSLKDPINKYLPYSVHHPNFKEIPITLQHLATHTSGITDEPHGGKGNIFSKKLVKENWREVWHPIITSYNTNIPKAMDAFLFDIFSEKGAWYSPATFLNAQPGSYYEYSNYGTALLAHIIEIVTKTDYRDYTRQHILRPLKMDRSGWSKAEVDTLNHIAYYNDRYHPVPDYRIITYPDGGFYSSIEDMTLFLQEMMKGYDGEGTILKSSSYQEMFTSHFPNLETQSGLIWDLDQDCCIGHGGNDFGIATMMYFYKDQGIGRILFSNLDVQQEQQDDAFYGIHNELYSFQ